MQAFVSSIGKLPHTCPEESALGRPLSYFICPHSLPLHLLRPQALPIAGEPQSISVIGMQPTWLFLSLDGSSRVANHPWCSTHTVTYPHSNMQKVLTSAGFEHMWGPATVPGLSNPASIGLNQQQATAPAAARLPDDFSVLDFPDWDGPGHPSAGLLSVLA